MILSAYVRNCTLCANCNWNGIPQVIYNTVYILTDTLNNVLRTARAHYLVDIVCQLTYNPTSTDTPQWGAVCSSINIADQCTDCDSRRSNGGAGRGDGGQNPVDAERDVRGLYAGCDRSSNGDSNAVWPCSRSTRRKGNNTQRDSQDVYLLLRSVKGTAQRVVKECQRYRPTCC